MKIEILETFLDGRDRYEKGEIREVSDESGVYFCGCGWAKDVEGKVETAERQKTGDVRLDIRKGFLNQKSEKV
jgi:hypothetical protein